VEHRRESVDSLRHHAAQADVDKMQFVHSQFGFFGSLVGLGRIAFVALSQVRQSIKVQIHPGIGVFSVDMKQNL